MKRDTVINVLLIIAGVVLAFALFGAGAFWKGKSSLKRSSQLMFGPVTQSVQQLRSATVSNANRSHRGLAAFALPRSRQVSGSISTGSRPAPFNAKYGHVMQITTVGDLLR